MRTRKTAGWTMTAAAVLAAAAVTTTWAGPVEPRHVADDARWYVHLDMEKMLATPLGAAVREHWTAQPRNARKLAQIKMITGMDVWADLKAVTLYGPSGDDTEAVAVIRATADAKALENTVVLAQDYNVMNHAGRRVHIWTPDDGRHDTMALCVADPTTFVLGVQPERVKAAVDAIDAAAAPTNGLVEKAAADRWLEMAVVDVHTLEGVERRGPWMDNVRTIRMTLGSDDRQMMMTMTGAMADAATAERGKAMIQGLKAMGELRIGEVNPDLLPMLGRFSIECDGDRLWIDFAAPNDDVIRLMKQHQEKQQMRLDM